MQTQSAREMTVTANEQHNLIFACLVPHAWLLVPLTGGAPGMQAQATRTAMEEMGLRLAAKQPETIVLITPHGLQIEQMVPLLDSKQVRGGVYGGGVASMGGTRHGFSLTFDVDRVLNSAIVKAGDLFDVPIVSVHYPLDWMALELDFGCTNPLWFLGAMLVPQPQLVVVSVSSWLTGEQCVHLGLSPMQWKQAIAG